MGIHKLVSTAALSACIALAALGCSKGPKSNPAAFNTAPPEIKKRWDSAMAARTTNGYAVALIQLRDLSQHPGLTADQKTTVEAVSTEINNEMYDSANKGEPAGKQALEELRSALGR